MQVIYDFLLGRFKETKADLKAAFARNPDDWGMHEFVLGLAYAEGNHAAIERETPWFAGRPEAIWRSLLAQAQNADFLGQHRDAKRLFVLLRQRNRFADFLWAQNDGLDDALLGNCPAVRDTAADAA